MFSDLSGAWTKLVSLLHDDEACPLVPFISRPQLSSNHRSFVEIFTQNIRGDVAPQLCTKCLYRCSGEFPCHTSGVDLDLPTGECGPVQFSLYLSHPARVHVFHHPPGCLLSVFERALGIRTVDATRLKVSTIRLSPCAAHEFRQCAVLIFGLLELDLDVSLTTMRTWSSRQE